MHKFCVLMSTFNGEKYLKEQIDSILEQKNVELKLLIRDDGSSDNTKEIIDHYLGRYPDKIVYCNDEKGKNIGFNRSYYLLLENAVRNYSKFFDYIAFSDQDDVWKEQKLFKACERLAGIKEEAVYFSHKTIVDSKLQPLQRDVCNYHGVFEDIFDRANASGCTMVLNKNYATVLVEQMGIINCPFIYDSYFFRTAIVCGYHICYDKDAYIYYRQHDDNAIGAWGKEERWYKKFRKTNVIFSPKEHYYQKVISYIKEHNGADIAERNRKKVEWLLDYDKNPLHKIALMWTYAIDSKSDMNRKLIIEMRILFNIV